MMRQMRSGRPTLFKKGSRSIDGKLESTLMSIDATIEMAELFQTSFGPNGMHKIIINHLDKVSITSDASAIIKDLEVNHPAANMIATASKMQEKEMGDGCNLVLIFSGELCRNAKRLIKDGVGIVDIVKGYQFALKKTFEIMDSLTIDFETIKSQSPSTLDFVQKVVKAAVSSKLQESSQFFVNLVASAIEPIYSSGAAHNVDNVRVCKVGSGNLLDSVVVHGLIVESDVEGASNRFVRLQSVKTVLFNGSVDVDSTDTKGVVLFRNAEDLKSFNPGEEKHIEERIRRLAEMGVRLIITGGKFGDMALHFMAKYGLVGIKITSKFELSRIARLLGCKAIPIFAQAATEKDFGVCKSVSVREVGSKILTFLEQDKIDTKLTTILLRGSTENALEKAERASDDGVNAIKTFSKNPELLAGGGASEIELAKRLMKVELSGVDPVVKFGLEGFARSLEIVPKLLAKSADKNADEVLAKMYEKHQESESNGCFGIDSESGQISDMKEKSIFDLLSTKVNAIRLATEAVCCLLRVDNIIMAKPAGGPKFGKKHDWDED